MAQQTQAITMSPFLLGSVMAMLAQHGSAVPWQVCIRLHTRGYGWGVEEIEGALQKGAQMGLFVVVERKDPTELPGKYDLTSLGRGIVVGLQKAQKASERALR